MTITPASGKKAKIVVYQGATFDQTYQFKNSDGTAYNLTGRTAAMQMRQDWYAENAIFTLTTENGGITIDGTAGTLRLYISAEDSALLPIDSGVYDIYVYDDLVDPPTADRMIMGEICISPEVTR